MAQEGLAFAAVHDSYWTHACDVDRMNTLLREEFVDLHSRPILEDLHEMLKLRYPEVDRSVEEHEAAETYGSYGSRGGFLPPPPKGKLDLQLVKQSPYFFD